MTARRDHRLLTLILQVSVDYFHKHQPLAAKPYEDIRLGFSFPLGNSSGTEAARVLARKSARPAGSRPELILRRYCSRERLAQEFFQDLTLYERRRSAVD